MKVYQFNEDTGLYEGEIFADSATLTNMGGVTMIAPPEYPPGQVPVFETTRQQWQLLPVAIARQLLLGRRQ